jgi:DNA-binding XRE family transcriptional regulator
MTVKWKYRHRRHEVAKQIADRCRKRREELGYSRPVAAMMAQIGSRTATRIESPSGNTLPALDALIRYCDALGLSLADIFAEEDAKA